MDSVKSAHTMAERSKDLIVSDMQFCAEFNSEQEANAVSLQSIDEDTHLSLGKTERAAAF